MSSIAERIKIDKQRIREEKERIKEEKKAEKVRLRMEKQRLKEEKQRLKLEDKIRKLAFREGILMERRRQKQENDNHKYEVKRQSICNMIRVARSLDNQYPDGFTASQCVSKYIEMYGYINPYTLEKVSATYDIAAAIRGLMYETSPSSEQHWFRYGIRKTREQVAPWIFVNKELAINNTECWNR